MSANRPMSASKAMLPVQGIAYLWQHQQNVLWQGTVKTVGIALTASVVGLMVLYTRGWSLQQHAFSWLLGTGWASTALVQALLAAEAALAGYLILKRAVGSHSGRVFDAVLAQRGITKVQPLPQDELDELRSIAAAEKKAAAERNRNRSMLGKAAHFALRQVQRHSTLSTAPLLIVPGIGWMAYLYVNALDEGAACHQRYFRRKGISDPSLQQIIVRSHEAEYRAFGCTVLLLNFIPIVNWVLGFAGAAGAALWAADMELKGEKWLQANTRKKA